MQIIKELVNNVYKHAAATFIHLEIALNEESRFVITCQMMERNQMTLKIFFLPKVVCCS